MSDLRTIPGSVDMTVQTLTIGKRKYVVIAERDYERLRKKAGETEVRDEVADEAMRDLGRYRRTGKAIAWSQAKRKLGL